MPPSFEEIRSRGLERWSALTQGTRPWIRIGTALCGKAAGADEVIAALVERMDQQNVNAIVSEVGCLGPCFRRAASRCFDARRLPRRLPECDSRTRRPHR